MNKILTIISVFLLAIGSLQAQSLNPKFSVQCLGVEMDGSQTLRVEGYGRNKSDAKEQAMKNAVWAIVFNGIRSGVSGCDVRPVLTEVNARERYEDYFNIFFKDDGEYKKYVSLRDTKKGSAKKAKDKVGYNYTMTIRVLRSELKARFKEDGLIKN